MYVLGDGRLKCIVDLGPGALVTARVWRLLAVLLSSWRTYLLTYFLAVYLLLTYLLRKKSSYLLAGLPVLPAGLRCATQLDRPGGMGVAEEVEQLDMSLSVTRCRSCR